jgi:hypothetical protein
VTEQRWHALTADPRGASYSLALPGWLERGLTLDGVYDLQEQALRPAMRRPRLRAWWGWLLDHADARTAVSSGGGAVVEQWVAAGEPDWTSLPWHVDQLELHHPDLSAQFMRAHLTGDELIDYEVARSLRREADAFLADWNAHRDERLATPHSWPAGVALVQTSGNRALPSLLTDTGATGTTLPPLVSTAFVNTLTEAGCAAGWQAQPIGLVDQSGAPIDTHVALFLRHDLRTNWWQRGPLNAYVLDEQPHTAALAYDHGSLCASPDASRALTSSAALADLALEPLSWEHEVPEHERRRRSPGP